MAGAQCCENPPVLNPSCGEGSVECLVGDIKSYVTGSASSKKAVILASDVFGFEAPNLRKLADKVAGTGFFVVVPDYFYGDPYVPEKCVFTEWLKFHGPHKGIEYTKLLIADLRSKGISSIGIAGFCWGAKVVAELAKTDDIQAAVMLHPSLVTVDDIKEVKVPIAILAAETDHISPPELIKKFEQILSSKSEVIAYYLHTYPILVFLSG
ncbi:unnamed protein product [Victoria cruziana]